MTEDLLIDGPADAPLTVVLAHGAGAPMDHPFMTTVATGLADRGWGVVRFEFPYMARRRAEGGRRPPDREPVLRESWARVLAGRDPARTVLAGKSMGGRIASLIAEGWAGLICLGYPFHGAGKPVTPARIAHLATLTTPTLILQGERDSLGDRATVAGIALADAVTVTWLPDGDHGFKPRKASGHTEAGNLDRAVAAMDAFLREIAP